MPYRLEFFAVNRDNTIIKIDESYFFGQPTVTHILRLAQNCDDIDQNDQSLYPIQILMVLDANLASPYFYHNLAGASSYKNECRNNGNLSLLRRAYYFADQPDAAYVPSPIITIGSHQVMKIYEESLALDFETHPVNWQELRGRDQKWMYKYGFDPRIKFLDSSIWHRYLAYDDEFEYRFIKLLDEIIGYANCSLYKSLAAQATLEFQCRMLQQSYIHKFGDQGHHEAVTPYKFHSETIAAEKINEFIEFFKTEGENKKLADLEWNILLVDDFAAIPVSSMDKKSALTKADLLKELLDSCDIRCKFHYTDGPSGLIEQGIEKLKRDDITFDLILLDYLLGESETGSGEKAYGYEFLLELATNGEGCSKGVLGRYWIMPTSSFPVAFSDKLRQLNVDGVTSRWYIANGGDPITTPEFYCLSVLRILLRQISSFYLFEAALMRQIERFSDIRNRRLWCRALEDRLNEQEAIEKSLESDSERQSLFASKMQGFLEEQNKYKVFIGKLIGWTREFSNYTEGKSGLIHKMGLNKMEEEFPKFSKVINHLREKANTFIYNATNELLRKIEDDEQTISIGKKGHLFSFPDELSQNTTLTSLDLSNQMLVSIPLSITQLKGLSDLNLSNNPKFNYLPAALMLKHNEHLKKINLEGTAIGDYLLSQGEKVLSTYEEGTRKILKKIKDYYEKTGTEYTPPESHNPVIKIFVSYEVSDYDEISPLFEFIKPLEDYEVVYYNTTPPMAGESHEEKIAEWAKLADIILLILTPKFINSKEMHLKHVRANTKKFAVIPVFYNYCSTDFILNEFRGSGLPTRNANEPIVSNRYPIIAEAFKLVLDGLRKTIDDHRSSSK